MCILQLCACRGHFGRSADAGPPPVVAAAPKGYVEGHVLRSTSPTPGGGSMVLLSDASETIALPIFIGGTEAMSIDLRLRGDKYTRPLTHDILSETIHELGGRAVQVQVDDLVSDTYRGTVVLERSDGSFATLDARPSDCIALSLGEKVPIYVKKTLLDTEGVAVPGSGGGTIHSHNPTNL
ncbi:MAG TPA: bifunctional nuclease family protein [Polyangiaceae bacterium]